MEVSESSTSLTGESRSDAPDADRSVLANYPHSRAASTIPKMPALISLSPDRSCTGMFSTEANGAAVSCVLISPDA